MVQPHSFTLVFFDPASSRSNLRSILPDGLLGIAFMTLTPPRSLLWLATRSETHAAIAVSTFFLPLAPTERTTEISFIECASYHEVCKTYRMLWELPLPAHYHIPQLQQHLLRLHAGAKYPPVLLGSIDGSRLHDWQKLTGRWHLFRDTKFVRVCGVSGQTLIDYLKAFELDELNVFICEFSVE
jgi:hypothetical protein